MNKPLRYFLVAIASVLVAFLAIATVLQPDTVAGPCIVVRGPAMLRDVPEASGLAISRRHPGLIWTHNDSGHDTDLFGVDTASGNVVARVRVPIRTRDWEDISSGPCPLGDCVYIADIGDNGFARRNVQVLRVPEPGLQDALTPSPEVFTLVYPDGRHNAEALFVVGEALIIVTRDRAGAMYRATAPLVDKRTLTLQRIGEVGVEVVSDAETSTDGQLVVLRNSHEVVVYRTADLLEGRSASGLHIPVERLREAQGEGVALDGNMLYLTSEGGPWSRAGRMLSLRCSLPSRPAPSAAPSRRGAASGAR